MSKKHPNLAKIGKKIRAFRKERGLSQEDLAYEASLGRGYYGRIERGEQNVSVQNLIKIALILRVDPAQFLPSLRQLKMPPAAKNSNR